MLYRSPARFLALVTAWFGLAVLSAFGEPIILLDETRHLGWEGLREWNEVPDPLRIEPGLDLAFALKLPPKDETCLLIRHRGVKLRWRVRINGKEVGTLPALEQDQTTALSVPKGTLLEGTNQLTISGPEAPDDIQIRRITLIRKSVEEILGEAQIEVRVKDQATGMGLPCRITVTTPDGSLVSLRAEPAGRLAVREGVVYTGDGTALLSVMPGPHVIWASRGFEWSAVSQAVDMNPGSSSAVELELRREVPAPGWISVDSHIHTLTDSGHGDSTIEERMFTIAGEGIELAIATDHNHHADYTPVAKRLGVEGLFRHVTGNEVTTKLGHFNAFPIDPASPVADASIDDWERLVPAMRAVPGVRVVILNHPRNLHSGFVPMGPTQFDTVTGKHRRAAAFRGITGFEVVTSAAMQSDIHLLFRDWFALLNRGHRLAAVGSSDTHDVNRYLLGQARTYVAAEDKDGKFDLDQVWKSYEEGRLLVSMGLLAEIRVDGKHRTGDLATPDGKTIEVEVVVSGPSWTRADRVELYANGHLSREAAIDHPGGAIEKARVAWRLPAPGHDMHLVAIATGPGVDAPFCETPRPYQASSRDFHPRVIGATNPVWVDGDRDGVFSAALQTARRLADTHGSDPAKLIPILGGFDEAVAIQAAALCAEAGTTGTVDLTGSPDFVTRAFKAVLKKPASP